MPKTASAGRSRTKAPKTYGYERRGLVPNIDGTHPKLCPQCDSFFAARPKERRCDRCVPPNQRLRRLARAQYTEAETGPENSSQGRTGTSGRGQATTLKALRHAQMIQVRPGVFSDGGAMCREMAKESAVTIDYPKGLPVPMSKRECAYYIRRAVNLGLQGRCDLERCTQTTPM